MTDTTSNKALGTPAAVIGRRRLIVCFILFGLAQAIGSLFAGLPLVQAVLVTAVSAASWPVACKMFRALSGVEIDPIAVLAFPLLFAPAVPTRPIDTVLLIKIRLIQSAVALLCLALFAAYVRYSRTRRGSPKPKPSASIDLDFG